MVVKFFSNKSGGSARGIDYLLDKRVSMGSARVICGSEATTRAVLSMIGKKQKLTVGCLAFNELDMREETKLKIIRSFEGVMFADCPDKFNVLWVEHRDKANLELNFCIPKVELLNFRSFNPYYHEKDFSMINTWKNLINLKYGLTDPCDPKNQHIMQGSRKDLRDGKNYEELEKIVTDNLIKGEYRCRDDIIKSLRDSGIEVTRIGKDYISVKLPGSKKSKRFKGEIFNEKFRNFNDLGELASEARERGRAFLDTRTSEGGIQNRAIVNLLRAYRRQNRGQSLRYEFKERISRKDLNLAILAYNLEEAKKYRNNEIKKLLSLGAKSYGAGINRTRESGLEIESEIVKNEVEFNVNKDNQKGNIDERVKDYERDARDLGEGRFRKNELRGAIIDRIVSKRENIRTLISNLERKREHRVSKQSDLVVKRGNIEKLSDYIDANEKVIESTSGFRKFVKGFG